MESATIQKSNVLSECRESVRAAQSARDNLVHRLEALGLQKTSLEASLTELGTRRVDCIGAVASGAAGDADLHKIEKSIDKTRDDLRNTVEYVDVTQSILEQADRELRQATESLKAQELKAWRQVSATLIEQHRAQIQTSLDEIFVAVNSHQPMTLYFSLVNSLGLKVPEEAEYLRIRGRLAQEFGI